MAINQETALLREAMGRLVQEGAICRKCPVLEEELSKLRKVICLYKSSSP